jgi:hypothetical protein
MYDGLGPGMGSTQVVSIQFARSPYLAPPRPTPGSVPRGSSGVGGSREDVSFLLLLTNGP